jgi:hypothetical protein
VSQISLMETSSANIARLLGEQFYAVMQLSRTKKVSMLRASSLVSSKLVSFRALFFNFVTGIDLTKCLDDFCTSTFSEISVQSSAVSWHTLLMEFQGKVAFLAGNGNLHLFSYNLESSY